MLIPRLPLLLVFATSASLAQSSAAPPEAKPPTAPDTALAQPATLIVKNILMARSPAPAPCFTMRTYAFKRDDQSSDVLRPAGYSTCQPASRLRMKQAEAIPSR